jgi:hypothetical protein
MFNMECYANNLLGTIAKVQSQEEKPQGLIYAFVGTCAEWRQERELWKNRKCLHQKVSHSISAENELSVESQTIDAELYAQAREDEGYKWGER